ncbi:hypothetical protein EIP86_002199 [Pleurotus ostreatoroseus]|nr:hypothetical protein EIP86_002199 [Pleurotus ostreatoroseus]
MGCGRRFADTTRPDAVKRHQQSTKCKRDRAPNEATGGPERTNIITPIANSMKVATADQHDHMVANASHAVIDAVEERLLFDYSWKDSTLWPNEPSEASASGGQPVPYMDEYQVNFEIAGYD